ncbi:TetR/AcrR family transcriptional regulator [Parasphingopyxis algicola]|uniref:TetR/AcrR family transcriptional regulator n=1 Tax=Parasphingopyxis algicola TaxID=2026624 RepID=UPI0015A23581|nr:TetR family transcriptional regulator [Parasphingopyxis algicola]QLC24756.1 TetR/AcrR family transcriptional regulator [Parasphingopyxis algicola]
MAARARPSNGSVIDWRKRRQEIADRALPLFLARPWANVTVEDIAAETGLSFWQIYYSFDGQEDVYRTSVTRLFDRLAKRVADRPEPGKTVLETVRKHVDFTAGILRDRSYRQILYLRIRDEPMEPWLSIQYRKKIAVPLIRNVKSAVSEAGNRQGLSIAVDDECCRQMLASLEARIAFPSLLHSEEIDTQSSDRAVDSSARTLWAATYNLDEPMPLSA